MEQKVAHSRGECNSRCAFNVSGETTSMAIMYIEDGSPVLRFRIVSGAPEWVDWLSGVPE